MFSAEHLSAEQAELASVISSETFLKSPNLTKLLEYICQKYFQGEAGDLKEYNIAVEGFGRSPDFDPAVNSIVRVEVRRLRERLKKYYEAEGATHRLMITLEVGSYVPHFVERAAPVEEVREEQGTPEGQIAPENLPQPEVAGSAAEVRALLRFATKRKRLLAVVAGACLLVLLALLAVPSILSITRRNSASDSAASGVTRPLASNDEIRILAGYSKDQYVDRTGKMWLRDRYFTGGSVATEQPRFIARSIDPSIFQTARMQEFSYDIPLKPGVYELRLHWAETFFGPDTYAGGGESSRIFSVNANGAPLISDLDIFSAAGGNDVAYARVFKDIAPAPDGHLHLAFRRFKDAPFLNAIEIVPGLPGKLRPINIVAQDNSYTDREGRIWSPDQYFSGGRLVRRTIPVTGTEEPGMYMGERFGNFTYAVPVARSKYTVRLHFAEGYFGAGNTNFGGEGARVFDVYCNGSALLRGFDIYKEAGGAARAVVKTFHGLEPNASGLLLLTFTPSKNYAALNAIEILDEAK